MLIVSEKYLDDEKKITLLFRVSKKMFHEAASVYYSCHQMIFKNYNDLTQMLQNDQTSMMATFLTHVWIRTKGAAPSKAYKLLAECRMLRTLYLDFTYNLELYTKYDNYTILKSRGVGDLLKIRGLEKVTVSALPDHYKGWEFNPSDEIIDRATNDLELFVDRLQVLKEPRTSA